MEILGGRRERARRLAALGPLAGTATGVGIGAAAGALRAAGRRLPTAVGGPLLGVAAMLASDGPIAALGISDPRRWSRADWISDAVPHLVYGVTTHATLVAGLPDPGPAPRASALAGVIGLLAALGESALGVRARAAASRRFGSDLPGALMEDAAAALLGWLGARR